MPNVINEPVRTGEYIVGEEEDYRSRDVAVIAAEAFDRPAGTVLGKVTATGKLKTLAPTASDGTQNAVAILYQGVPANTEVKRTVHSRECTVNGNKLTWLAGTTDPQKVAATAQLTALGIITRV